jgi:programmed cell death protein 5
MAESPADEQQAMQLLLLKRRMLRQGMDSPARGRLARIRMANPDLAEKAESVCLQIIQQGKMVDEELLKKILERLSPKREIRITRR